MDYFTTDRIIKFLKLNTYPLCAAALGMIALIVFLKMRAKKSTAGAVIAKSVVSFFFIITCMMTTRFFFTRYSICILAGLVCGLLGDIWLDLKFCGKPEDSDTFTFAGFISFAVGHIFFTAGIITGTRGFKPVSILPAAGVGVVVGLVIFFGEKLMGLKYGKYKIISTLYGALLFFTTFFALFAALMSRNGILDNLHLILFFVGGVFFAISDLILSGTYFGEGKNRPVDIITNHVTYYIAQYIIAFSVLFSFIRISF